MSDKCTTVRRKYNNMKGSRGKVRLHTQNKGIKMGDEREKRRSEKREAAKILIIIIINK